MNPHLNGDFTDSYSKIAHNMGTPGLRRSWQISYGNVTDSWIWGLIFGRPGRGRSPHPHQTEVIIGRFLLWEFIFGRVRLDISTPIPQMAISQIPTNFIAHIWQVKSGHIYPNPPQWYHRFLLWELIFGRPDLVRSMPSLSLCVSNDNFRDSYSEGSYLADQVLADLPSSHQTVFSQIPTRRAHIWQTRSC